jgi:tRNA1Val (adenine37-N6)-methyltransferase
MRQRNPFQFKQFTVHQSRAAMPVTTDACIFGALIDLGEAKTALDVGTGTGLLSLMLAQRHTNTRFTGIDIDTESLKDAEMNFKESLWTDRLNATHADFLNWNTPEKFDAIVCNPPFFQNQLPSIVINKRNARHSHTLEHEKMVAKMAQMLNPDGQVWLLIPEIHLNDILVYLKVNKLHTNYLCSIRPSAAKPVHLTVLMAGTFQHKTTEQELVVYENGMLTEQTKTLLSGYYMNT